MAFTDLDSDALFGQMFGAARQEAGAGWTQISGVLKVELKTMSRQIKEIGKGVALGEISTDTAGMLMQMARNNLIMLLAMSTTMIQVTAEKIINAALAVVRGAVNGALGFPLL